MKPDWVLIVVSGNVAALLALAVIYPHLMISPGPLVEGHAELATDCFACHSPMQGARAERCITCHPVSDIGVLTTLGQPITRSSKQIAFHQELVDQDCVACHSDHAGPLLTQRSRKPFSHALLRVEVREQCETCHSAADDKIHRGITASCSQCHQQDRWRPAEFDHSKVDTARIDGCNGCHLSPRDALHEQLRESCAQCHSFKAWKPATFDHQKWFVLDRDHNASCATCHINNDFNQYTCYGCHEHSKAGVRAEHVEEGIRDFDNCVECHRSAQGEHEGRGSREHDD